MKASQLIRQLTKQFGTPAEQKIVNKIIEAMGVGGIEVSDAKVKTIMNVGHTLQKLGVK